MRTPSSSRRHEAAAYPGLLLSTAAALLLAGALAAGPAWALPSCAIPTAVNTCCNADQPGQTYLLAADLTESNATDCIDISAPNVIFEMNGHKITGPVGGGIGIHVLSTAPNAIVVGGEVVQDFATGFQTDAANTFSEEVVAEFNTTGTVINGPGAEALIPVGISSLGNGIVLTSAASGSFVFEPVAFSNAGNGVVLKPGTTAVTIADVVAEENAGYGLWLKGASFNSVYSGVLEGNSVAGVYVGCHAGGPSTAPCSIPPSNGNSISGIFSPGLTVGSCPGGSQHNQEIGVAIDKGNAKNHVVEVVTDTNSSCTTPGDTVLDGFDGNGPFCLGNFWLGDSFTKPPNHTASAAHPFCMD